VRAFAACIALSLAASAAEVSAEIYPAGPTLPANVLSLHVIEDGAAALGLDDVRLTDQSGAEIAGAFLDLLLPSSDGTGVTLLFHPGRVKSGLRANQTAGRVARPGDMLTLTIGPSESRSWRIVAAETTPIAFQGWQIERPEVGTHEPLLVHLGRAVDALAANRIALAGVGGTRVEGDSRLLPGETVWRFVPDAPWPPGSYELRIHPDLEDVAGNRICAPFEAVDLAREVCTEGRIGFDLDSIVSGSIAPKEN
jgi:hypothetical protein